MLTITPCNLVWINKNHLLIFVLRLRARISVFWTSKLKITDRSRDVDFRDWTATLRDGEMNCQLIFLFVLIAQIGTSICFSTAVGSLGVTAKCARKDLSLKMSEQSPLLIRAARGEVSAVSNWRILCSIDGCVL